MAMAAGDEEEVDAFSFRIGARVFAVLSLPAQASALPEPLTAAEQDVMRLVLGGLSNRDIAAARVTSERTVANQISTLFRKLRVGSRAELAVATLPAPDEVG
jgi:DNA-binding NarL/FixJ family response regulator